MPINLYNKTDQLDTYEKKIPKDGYIPPQTNLNIINNEENNLNINPINIENQNNDIINGIEENN